MLYSIAGASWKPWAAPHLIRFAGCFLLMIVLAVIDLRVWYALAYPVYAIALVLLLGVDAVGHAALGAQRWLDIGPVRIQPSEIMKIGLVLALARFYHNVSSQQAKLSFWLVIPAILIVMPAGLVAI